MAKSGQIDSRSVSAAADDVGRRMITENPTLGPQRTNSITTDDALSLSYESGKIIRFVRVLLYRDAPRPSLPYCYCAVAS